MKCVDLDMFMWKVHDPAKHLDVSKVMESENAEQARPFLFWIVGQSGSIINL